MRKQLVFFTFIAFHFLHSQERKMFFGKTIDDLGNLASVHIINKNTNTATSSNINGEFRIFAQPNDTIKFTFVGYKTHTLLLKNSDFGINEKQIHLKKEIIELDEIELKKHNLTGSLSSDVKNVNTKKEINAKSLMLPNANAKKLTQAERRLYTAMGGGVLGIDYIINLLSGRIKKLKKLKKIEENERQITYLKNSFTNYIIKDLKIKTNEVYRFIYFCQEDKDYKNINHKSEFTIIDFLKKKSIEFKKLNRKP